MGDGGLVDEEEDGQRKEEEAGDDERDRWVDGLLRYRFRPGVMLLSDPRGNLVRGTGASLWSAGKVLATFLAERRPDLCKGARCLELGSGTGAVGLTVAAAGARLVVLTDTELQLPLLKRNQQENCPSGDAIQALPLDWRKPEQRAALEPWAGTWSLVVGSDIGYDPDLFEPLLDTLESQWSWDTDVFFALADRGDEEGEPRVEDFVDAASGRGWSCEEVHQSRAEPHQSLTKILSLTRQAGAAPKAARLCCPESSKSPP